MTAAVAFNPNALTSQKEIKSNINRIKKKRDGLDHEFNRRVAARQSAKFDDNRAMNMFGGMLVDILTGGAGIAFMDTALDIVGDLMAGHGMNITKDSIQAAIDGMVDTADSETRHLRADNDNDPVYLAFVENEEMARKKAEEEDLDWFLILLFWVLWTDGWDTNGEKHNNFYRHRRPAGLQMSGLQM
jgi:hypothetical protein